MGHSSFFLPLRMIRVLAFLFLLSLALGDAFPDAKPDADADAYLHYGYNAGYYPGYYRYGPGYLGHYRLLGRKRRSADADAVPDAKPDADADAYLAGYYGHRLYGYGGLHDWGTTDWDILSYMEDKQWECQHNTTTS